ncbi:MAG: DUF924 domain-containing protein [Pseudomonadota bacterium]|nr:DUF924 domain-containing protein [Pseudomonadota bacterium]
MSERGEPGIDSIPDEARRVLDFWFSAPGVTTHSVDRPEWFRKDAAFDASIRDSFGALIEQALRSELASWDAAPESALAQIILLDQFTRNAFRDTPRAFAGDPRALEAARAAVGSHQDEALEAVQRAFIYLPFEHAEGIAMQAESVRLYTRLAVSGPGHESALDFAQRHYTVIERFGRFPHRNRILGRHSTAEELEFLKQPGSGF